MKKMVKLGFVFGLICSIILSAGIYASAAGGVEVSSDWEGSNSAAVTASKGDITTGYTVTTYGHFARYNNKINIKTGIKFKVNLDVGKWYSVGFSSSNDAKPGLNGGTAAGNHKVYILTRISDNKLTVQRYDGKVVSSETIDFDFSTSHTYGYRLETNGYFYFAIDGEYRLKPKNSVGDYSGSTYVNGINNNGEGGYVTVGSDGYAVFTNLRTMDDWTVSDDVFQNGDRDNGYTLSIYRDPVSFARLKYKLDAASGISFKIQPKPSNWYFISFEQNNSSAPGMTAASNKQMYLIRTNETTKKLSVSIYDGTNESAGTDIENFDFSASHTFSFKLDTDNYYRLAVDGNIVCRDASLPRSYFEEMNNNGEGVYITLGRFGWAILSDIKPVEWTNGAQDKPVKNENGGYDLTVPAGSAVRYNRAIDLKKGVMFKISKESDWFSFSAETTPKTEYGKLDNPLKDGKKIYIMYTSEAEQTLAANLWNGTAAVPASAVDFDTSAYLHLQYKKDSDGYWRLYANGRAAMPGDSVSDDYFNNYFNNGVLYVTIGANTTPAYITDFRTYAAPAIGSDTCKIDNGILYGLDTFPTVEEISQMVTTVNGTLRVYDNFGNLVEDGKIFTGFSVSSYLCNGDEAKLTVSIRGDIEPDGAFSADDSVLLKKKLLGAEELSEVALYAADVNGDKDINILDLIALKKKQSLT